MRKALDISVHVLKALVALLLLLMALLTGADVIGRYIFHRPVVGTDEMIAASMGLLIFSGLPLVTLSNSQITVDIGAGMFRGIGKRLQHFAVNLFCAAVLGFLAVQLWNLAGKSIQNSDQSSMLHIPTGPTVYAMAVMCALAGLISLCLAPFQATTPPSEFE